MKKYHWKLSVATILVVTMIVFIARSYLLNVVLPRELQETTKEVAQLAGLNSEDMKEFPESTVENFKRGKESRTILLGWAMRYCNNVHAHLKNHDLMLAIRSLKLARKDVELVKDISRGDSL